MKKYLSVIPFYSKRGTDIHAAGHYQKFLRIGPPEYTCDRASLVYVKSAVLGSKLEVA